MSKRELIQQVLRRGQEGRPYECLGEHDGKYWKYCMGLCEASGFAMGCYAEGEEIGEIKTVTCPCGKYGMLEDEKNCHECIRIIRGFIVCMGCCDLKSRCVNCIRLKPIIARFQELQQSRKAERVEYSTMDATHVELDYQKAIEL